MRTKAEQKRFKASGHSLKPVVTIAGNGLSDAVISELNRASTDHELIKVRVNADDRDDKQATIEKVVGAANAELVQSIGNVALIYKSAKKPNPKLSNILRSDIV